MRTSLLIASAIAAPALLLTACGTPTAPKPLKGTVQEIEYEPAKTKVKKTPVTVTTCSTPPAKKVGKKTTRPHRVCTTTKTGRYVNKTITVKPECYELDIVLKDGTETEICNEAAYRALSPGDRYSSAVNYSTWKALR